MTHEHLIETGIQESIDAKKTVLETMVPQIDKAAQIIVEALNRGDKILVCGNGGSAADSQHFVAELVVRFEEERKALPAIALTTNTSNLTACANDYSFDEIFSRQVQALGKPGDVLFAITTSGNSPNVISAINAAVERKMKIVALLGKDGGKLKDMPVDAALIVPHRNTARIQECHEMIIHILCKIIDSECKGM